MEKPQKLNRNARRRAHKKASKQEQFNQPNSKVHEAFSSNNGATSKPKVGRVPGPQIITEGSATIELPAHVFYNPSQVFNRDLTIAVLNQLFRAGTFSVQARKLPPYSSCFPAGTQASLPQIIKHKSSHSANPSPLSSSNAANPASLTDAPSVRPKKLYPIVRILEALAASGLRSIRFARELRPPPGQRIEIIANDIDPAAVNLMEKNATRNLPLALQSVPLRLHQVSVTGGQSPNPSRAPSASSQVPEQLQTPVPSALEPAQVQCQGQSTEQSMSAIVIQTQIASDAIHSPTMSQDSLLQTVSDSPRQKIYGAYHQNSPDNSAAPSNQPPTVTLRTSCADAALLMYLSKTNSGKRFQVVDIDPYGTAAPYLEAAMQAVEDGGLLCVTCTDMPVLCGIFPETCFAKYGALSLHSPHGHEVALRIVLFALQTHAARFSRVVLPLLSLSVDFYVRIFVRVFSSAARVKTLPSHTAHVFQCARCPYFTLVPMGAAHSLAPKLKASKSSKESSANAGAATRESEESKPECDLFEFRWTPFSIESSHGLNCASNKINSHLETPSDTTIQRKEAHKTESTRADSAPYDAYRCPECSGALHMAGPIWTGPLHNKEFVAEMLNNLNTADTGNSTDFTSESTQPSDKTSSTSATQVKEVDEQIVGGLESSKGASSSVCKAPVNAKKAESAKTPSLSESCILGHFPHSLARMRGMLALAAEELDVPLYYSLADLCQRLHLTQPSLLDFRSAILNAGYNVSFSHCSKQSVKTNAPCHILFDIMRSWMIKHPVAAMHLETDPVCRAILGKPPSSIADFTRHPSANPLSRQLRLLRYQQNPEPGWGPKPRAKRLKVASGSEPDAAPDEFDLSSSEKDSDEDAEYQLTDQDSFGRDDKHSN